MLIFQLLVVAYNVAKNWPFIIAGIMLNINGDFRNIEIKESKETFAPHLNFTGIWFSGKAFPWQKYLA